MKAYDGGKKIVGMKRHVLVDAEGRLLMIVLMPADWSDSRTAVFLLRASRRFWPFIKKLFADRGYAGKKVAKATSIDVTIVTGPKNQKGFIVQKRRWWGNAPSPGSAIHAAWPGTTSGSPTPRRR